MSARPGDMLTEMNNGEPSSTDPTDLPKTIGIVIADDHAVVRRGLKQILASERDMVVVGEAKNGHEALDLVRRLEWDVAILDLRMPRMTGQEALAEIRKADPEARIVILTTFHDDDDVYGAIRAGARGYILKDASGASIIDAIKTVDLGQRYIPDAIAERLAEHVEQPLLTPREVDVLRLAARGNKNKEIGSQLGITEGTVKGYVNNILLKLRARDRTDAVTTALRRGIIKDDPSTIERGGREPNHRY